MIIHLHNAILGTNHLRNSQIIKRFNLRIKKNQNYKITYQLYNIILKMKQVLNNKKKLIKISIQYTKQIRYNKMIKNLTNCKILNSQITTMWQKIQLSSSIITSQRNRMKALFRISFFISLILIAQNQQKSISNK
ncbi:hypothetical protein TTHERM_000160539 (macronuclear) [Tetrahymena thermophila SB210]|uniref:Uncharacterized protein n=1 Tax=Tetrahymena thermophila (strain SB210) TaxID=312017 RepID=W7XGA6_TETTS|nr:hypothetical protein TTHERM_000160539 [Tetrahymena thermophila SB210]EWS75968.1 hypothetical protein TTHERM_000160539 [Tetrahymena thermophila SB210]|eukprot:XP_012651486.1 hypothetical protein TTHERM_000160539 [Tetrahymena thermophila SB210]